MRFKFLILFLAATSIAAAQSVGDFTIPYKANSTGPQTPKSWAGGNSKLWGTNSSGNPQSVTIGSGLTLTDSTLTASGGGSGSGTVTSVNASVPNFLSVAGVPITTSGTISISLSGTALPTANGGTGQTSFTNGQILIGNSTGYTLTKATLTAGSGITVTNGGGSITLSIGTDAITNTMLAGSIATSKLSVSSNVKSVLDAADFAGIRSAISLVPGTNVQAWGANLDTLSAGFGGFFSGFLFWDKTTQSYSRSTTITNTYLANSSFTVGGTTISLGDNVSAATFKTALSLNLVENTALSSWGGSTFITTLGTVTSGTWSATAIGVSKGGTGQTTYTDGQILIGNSTGNTLTKAALTAGSGITVTNGGGSITLSIANSAITDAMLAGSISNSKLSTNPLARANHTGTQTLSTISDAGSLAALSSVTSAYITDGTIVDADVSSSASIAISKLAKLPVEIVVACSDETTALTTGTAKVTFRMPHAMTLTSVRLNVNTAPTGSVIIVDVKEAGTTIFSTKPQIAVSAFTSVGGAVPGVISDSSLADDAEITINLDQIGSTIAGKGLKVTLVGTR